MEPLSALFHHTPVPMAVLYAGSNRVQIVNDAWRRFWNVPDAVNDGQLLSELLTPEQAGLYSRLLGTDTDSSEVAVSVMWAGQCVQRYIRLVVTQVPAVDQKPAYLGTVILDVTDTVLARQRADALAKEQEEQRRMMREALDSSPVAIVVATSIRDETTGQLIDFEYRLANRESNRLSNLPEAEELSGKRMLATFPGDKESGVFSQFKTVVETGEPLAVETHYKHGQTDKWFYVRVVKHGDGYVQTTLDITPVKEAEAAIEEQADLLRTILNNSQTAISLHSVIRGQNGKIADFKTALANKRAQEIWGDTLKQHMSRSFLEHRPEAAGTPEFERYVQVVNTGEPARFEFGVADKLYSINIARAGDGVVLSSVDITSDRQYQRQLEQINAELKRSNESLQAFAYIASHDLQEPLRKITSFSSILSGQYTEQLDDRGLDILVRIQSSAERMSSLIRDLLSYARIGSQPDSFRPVDLHTVLTELLNDMEFTVGMAGATIQLDQLPQVVGDPVQLHQLFQNLLSNAVKFHREGVPPVVQISSERVADDRLPPSLRESRPSGCSFWAIRVADNGIGFDEKYNDRIFQVFQRLHSRNLYSGTGIGLAIVRKVAEQHGGVIIAESRPDAGSTFTVYLPG
ncbi:sensor histidine kinase [Spirosoma rhododendri]|uniref:histidine kinase n=1 Tax=Spirosoma rhododendri TaxID=2728024 RepID=A0A7L5DSE2_9BACT|nr:ATP-binding protein [Spirosoma rhododendri]QJD79478.1 PAS domain-containing protein [Spirosoma rhododendri]